MPLAHTRLLVVRFAECFRFYRDVLQLQPSWGDEEDSYASFRQDPEGKVVLELYSELPPEGWSPSLRQASERWESEQ